MSVSKHVFESFLRPCKAVFGDPPTEDAELFFAEYDRQLRGFSAEALANAKDTVIRNHKGPARWPKPAVCVDAAAEAAELLGHKAKSREKSSQEVYFHRYRKAEERLHCEMGRRAAREGWVLGLKEFVTEKDRMPSPSEIVDLKANSLFVDRCAAGVEQMGYFHDSLQALAQKMLRRRESLATRIVGAPENIDLSRRMTGDRE